MKIHDNHQQANFVWSGVERQLDITTVPLEQLPKNHPQNFKDKQKHEKNEKTELIHNINTERLSMIVQKLRDVKEVPHQSDHFKVDYLGPTEVTIFRKWFQEGLESGRFWSELEMLRERLEHQPFFYKIVAIALSITPNRQSVDDFGITQHPTPTDHWFVWLIDFLWNNKKWHQAAALCENHQHPEFDVVTPRLAWAVVSRTKLESLKSILDEAWDHTPMNLGEKRGLIFIAMSGILRWNDFTFFNWLDQSFLTAQNDLLNSHWLEWGKALNRFREEWSEEVPMTATEVLKLSEPSRAREQVEKSCTLLKKNIEVRGNDSFLGRYKTGVKVWRYLFQKSEGGISTLSKLLQDKDMDKIEIWQKSHSPWNSLDIINRTTSELVQTDELDEGHDFEDQKNRRTKAVQRLDAIDKDVRELVTLCVSEVVASSDLTFPKQRANRMIDEKLLKREKRGYCQKDDAALQQSNF